MRKRARQKFQSTSSDRSVRRTLPYTKIPTRPQHNFPLLLVTVTSIYGSQTHIRFATSLTIFMTILPPKRAFTMSRTMTLPCPLPPLPVQSHHSSPYLSHYPSTTASRLRRCLATRFPFTRPPKASAFLLLHQVKPLLLR